MPGYRLYRSVVAGATGKVGQALTKQLLLSPLCAEVHTVGRSESRSFDGLAAAKKKLNQHSADISKPLCGLDVASLTGADAAFCVLGARGGWGDSEEVAAVERDGAIRFAELCQAAGIPHISLLTSAWAEPAWSFLPFSKLQAEVKEAYGSMDTFQRISLFQSGALVDEHRRTFERPGAPFWARALWSAAPTTAQLMPTSFRPIRLEDLALAMRLNHELCDTRERVEHLGFKEMMMVIGREDEV